MGLPDDEAMGFPGCGADLVVGASSGAGLIFDLPAFFSGLSGGFFCCIAKS